MNEKSTLEALRRRACELADTHRFSHWDEIAVVMQGEGFPLAMQRLDLDQALRSLLKARFEQCVRERDGWRN